MAGVVRDLLGNIYGTTSQGGSKGCGVLFQYVPGPRQFIILHDFCTANGDGSAPVSGLLMKGNVKTNTLELFGTRLSGGTNGCGTVYNLILGSGITTIHNFGSGSDGCFPTRGGSLIFDISKTILYGSTLNGGAYGNGVVYQVGIDGSNPAVLYNFIGGTDGGLPYGALLRKGRNLLGTTTAFGASGWGTVFKLVLP